jgi:adenylylsulfate kinase
MPQGFTLWLTGLPGSGKSTLAGCVEETLLEQGMDIEMIDDDMMREDFGDELGSDAASDDKLSRRASIIANLLTRNSVPAIVADDNPRAAVRDEARDLIGSFIEVFCNCAPKVAEERSGKKAADYETPEKAEIVVDTDKETVEESCKKIVKTLHLMDLISSGGDDEDYNEEEEAKIKKRLKDLGYI